MLAVALVALLASWGFGPQDRRPLTVAAYYYSWYGPGGRHWSDGYVRGELVPQQLPSMGEYDSRDPGVIARHFEWAHTYGVDVFVCSWWGVDSYEDVTIRDSLLASPAIGPTKIAILYESTSLLTLTDGRIEFDAANQEKLLADFDHLARTYLTNPAYYRIDGKPVVYFYVTRIYRGAYADALNNMRAAIKSRYGLDLYLVGDEVEWSQIPDENRIKLFDAITGYTMYSDLQPSGWPADTGFLTDSRARFEQFRKVASKHGVRFIPNAQPGFNDRGVRPGVNHYVLPTELDAGSTGGSTFRATLEVARDFIDPTYPQLDVTSWNEWHEDTQLEPTGAVEPSSEPALYTQGYRHIAYGLARLEQLAEFKRSWLSSR